MSVDAATLRDRFADTNGVTFVTGTSGLPEIAIANNLAEARIALQGAHVMAFCPRGEQAVLFMSDSAEYRPGKALRGGVPVCWPWFGPHPSDSDLPSHGLVRTALWNVIDCSDRSDGSTAVTLRCTDSDDTRAHWPHAFEASLTVVVGRNLDISLDIINPGSETFTCTGALHSYFVVGDSTRIAIEGLQGLDYLDQLTGRVEQHTDEVLTIQQEVDRIYLDGLHTHGSTTIDDPVLDRRIVIEKRGSRSTVVWNPWIDKSKRLGDLGDEDYHDFVCIETANAHDDVVSVNPSEHHTLRAIIGVRPRLEG